MCEPLCEFGFSAVEHRPSTCASATNYMAARKTPTATWVLRWYTIFLSIQYVFFSSAFGMQQYFRRAIIANGVVCALRLHQRIPHFGLSRCHLGLILQEDSAHYLIYSIIFLMTQPVTIALVPVCLFALIHACSYTRQLLDMHGACSFPLLRRFINHVAKHQAGLYRFIALNEALIFPTVVAMVVCHRSNLMSAFLYYKFLHYRYLSKRNPYCRVVFFEIRMTLEQMIQSRSSLLGPFSPLISFLISFVCLLAPPVTPLEPEI